LLKVYKDGALIALCENPVWVCKQDNGCYGGCDKESAEGIVVNSTVYNLLGHEISENGTVVCEETNGGEYIFRQQGALDDLIVTILEG